MTEPPICGTCGTLVERSMFHTKTPRTYASIYREGRGVWNVWNTYTKSSSYVYLYSLPRIEMCSTRSTLLKSRVIPPKKCGTPPFRTRSARSAPVPHLELHRRETYPYRIGDSTDQPQETNTQTGRAEGSGRALAGPMLRTMPVLGIAGVAGKRSVRPVPAGIRCGQAGVDARSRDGDLVGRTPAERCQAARIAHAHPVVDGRVFVVPGEEPCTR
jgi:hypothetical protein